MSDDERFIDFGSAAVVPLSSVRQPSQLIGRTAVQLLIEEEADSALSPRQVVFQPELVVRASTTASPSIPNSGGY